MAATPPANGAPSNGYWLVASDGGIFAFGDAHFYGSTGGIPPQPADRRHGPRPRTEAATGWSPPTVGIFSFGDATSTAPPAAIHLNQPIVGMAATADGTGYWLVASDGGDLRLRRRRLLRIHGRRPAEPAHRRAWPPTPVGPAATGWWPPTVASSPSGRPVLRIDRQPGAQPTDRGHGRRSPDGAGYRFVASDGGVFDFGSAHSSGPPATRH